MLGRRPPVLRVDHLIPVSSTCNASVRRSQCRHGSVPPERTGGHMKESERGLAADINVTPMIDVLLVLLVILMMVPRGRPVLDLNVPPDRSPSGNPLPQIVLELRADRSYAINGTPIAKRSKERRVGKEC